MNPSLQKYAVASQEVTDHESFSDENGRKGPTDGDNGVSISELAEKRPAAKYYCYRCDDTYRNQVRALRDAEKNGHTNCWKMRYNFPQSWKRNIP